MAGNGSLRSVGQLLFVGSVLAAAIVLGYLLGSYVDSKLNSSPWCLVAGVALGTAAGFAELWRTVKKLG